MEEQEERVVEELFGIPNELAREAIQHAGKDVERIKRYLQSKTKTKDYGVCKICGKKLTDPQSIARGCGIECYNRKRQDMFSMFEE